MKDKKLFVRYISLITALLASVAMIVIVCVNLAFAQKSVRSDSFTFTKNYTCDIDNRNGLFVSSIKDGASYVLVEEMSDVFDVSFRVLGSQVENDGMLENVSDYTMLTFSLVDSKTQIGIDISLEEVLKTEWKHVSPRNGNEDKISIERYYIDVNITHPEKIVSKSQDLDLKYRKPEYTSSEYAEDNSYYIYGNTYTLTGEGGIVRFGFDIYENEIFYYDVNGIKKIYLDLDLAKDIGQLGSTIDFPTFETYSLSIKMKGIKSSDKPASVVLYSLNGQSLDGENFTNESGAVVCGTAKINNGVLNKEYVISTDGLKTYDVLDGISNGFTGDILVLAPNGEIIKVKNNSFTPTIVGNYSLLFDAKDSNGVVGRQIKYDFFVYAEEPLPNIELDYSIHDSIIAKGGCIYLPSAKVSSELTLLGKEPVSSLIVKKVDGSVYKELDYSKINKVIFDEIGEYVVEYSSISDYGSKSIKTCNVTVQTDLPVFEIKGDFIGVEQFNEIFTIPAAKVEGDLVSHKVIYPSGATTTAKQIKLDEVGEYAIEYISGEYVYNLNFSVKVANANLFQNVKGVEIINFSEAPTYAVDQTRGVKLTGKRENATVNFVNPLNISDNTKDDNVIKFSITPENEGVFEFSTLTFTLADFKNPDIFVKVQLRRGTKGEGQVSLVYAMTNTMNDYSCVKDEQGNELSHSVRVSFSGIFNHLSYGKYPFTSTCLNYDNKTESIYFTLSDAVKSYQREIINLKNVQHVGVGNEFGGFPSGMATLSISFEDVISSNASITVYEIDGQDLTSEFTKDQTPPEFLVDFDGYIEGNLPVGVVNKDYKIFKASALDMVDGNCDYNVAVYYLNNGKQVRYYKHSAYSFTPDKAGEYLLLYTATDYSGNVSQKKISVFVESSATSLGYYSNIQAKGKQGVRFVIPEGTVSGGSGKVEVETTVYYNGKQVELLNGGFIPSCFGEYTVIVKLTDFLGDSFIKDYVVEIEENNKPILVPSYVPNIVLMSEQFIFEPWFAYDYTSVDEDGNPSILSVSINVNGQEIPNGIWMPQSEGDYEIEFIAGNGANISSEKFNIKVVSPTRDNRKLVNYFYFENSTTLDGSRIQMPIQATEGNAKVSFLKRIDKRLFSTNFSVDEKKNNFNSIVVTIADSKNLNQVARFEIIKGDVNSLSSLINLNGVGIGSISGTFHNANNPFEFSYDYKSGTFKDYAGNVICKDVFFDSDYVYLSYEMLATESDSVLYINSICGQPFGTHAVSGDYNEPSIIKPEISKIATFGQRVTIKPAYAFDVLSTVVAFTMTIESPSGKILLDSVDAQIENSFIVEEYGVYVLSYYVKDGNGNDNIITYNINCYYNVVPEIYYSSEMPIRAKINEEITLPTVEIAGDREDVLISIILIEPSGTRTEITSGKVVFRNYGKNKIVVMAYDKYNNIVVETFDIIVE